MCGHTEKPVPIAIGISNGFNFCTFSDIQTYNLMYVCRLKLLLGNICTEV